MPKGNSARSRAPRLADQQTAAPSTDGLKKRCAKLGLKLARDCTGRLYLLDPQIDELLAVSLDEKGVEHELKYLEGPDSAPRSRPRDAIAHIRRAVKRVVKAYADGGQDCTIEFDRALAKLEKAVGAGGAA